MRIQGIRASGRATDAGAAERSPVPLRMDARRNLGLVLNAAREVFGEQGYGAPIEEVARRASVGVGTIYRRFPTKDALVRHIAEEETRRLTLRAREALASGEGPWPALAGFVRRSAAVGTGRMLPPELLVAIARPAAAGGPRQGGRVADEPAGPRDVPSHVRELLGSVGQLVERTRAAGELRPDVTVADLMLVIAALPPALAEETQRQASARLLELLMRGLRPAGR